MKRAGGCYVHTIMTEKTMCQHGAKQTLGMLDAIVDVFRMAQI